MGKDHDVAGSHEFLDGRADQSAKLITWLIRFRELGISYEKSRMRAARARQQIQDLRSSRFPLLNVFHRLSIDTRRGSCPLRDLLVDHTEAQCRADRSRELLDP